MYMNKYIYKNKHIYFYLHIFVYTSGLPQWLSGKESACNTGNTMDVDLIPWRRKWQLSLVFLPGKSHGQRSLVDYSPQDHEEYEMT